MENNILKEKVRKNVKEKIAVANIREELGMSNKNKKSIYWIASVCAVCVIGFGIVVGTNSLNNKEIDNNFYAEENVEQEKNVTELKINKIENMAMKKLDAEMKNLELENLPEKFVFIDDVKLPEEYKLEGAYNIFTKEDVNIKKYNLLHDYVLCYAKDDVGTIEIAFSEVGAPLRDYFINSQNEVSKIGEVEIVISQFEDKYLVSFDINGLYFDIETNGITESELVELLSSIILK